MQSGKAWISSTFSGLKLRQFSIANDGETGHRGM